MSRGFIKPYWTNCNKKPAISNGFMYFIGLGRIKISFQHDEPHLPAGFTLVAPVRIEEIMLAGDAHGGG
jgi:hypothetical protein